MKEYERIKAKLELLQKIDVNTNIQMNFIRQRKMKGLLRLLKERGQYLQQLEVLNREFAVREGNSITTQEIQNLLRQIKTLQEKIVRDNNAVLEAAQAEQASIAADLKRVNARKRLRTSYDYQWIKISGSQLNQKG